MTPPTAGTANCNGSPCVAGWYRGDVTITAVNGSDALSGHKSTTTSVSKISSDTTRTKVRITTTDQAGNSSYRDYTIKMDKTAPTPGTATFTGTQGSNGWYTSNVTVNVQNGSDATSGHKSTTTNISSITSNTTGTTVRITTTDNAGNSNYRDYTIKIDKTTPIITVSGSSNVTPGTNSAIPGSYFTITSANNYSGTSTSCIDTSDSNKVVTNTITLGQGSHNIKCTVTRGNGKTANVTKTINMKCPDNYLVCGIGFRNDLYFHVPGNGIDTTKLDENGYLLLYASQEENSVGTYAQDLIDITNYSKLNVSYEIIDRFYNGLSSSMLLYVSKTGFMTVGSTCTVEQGSKCVRDVGMQKGDNGVYSIDISSLKGSATVGVSVSGLYVRIKDIWLD